MRLLSLLLIVSIALPAEYIDLCWETKNVVFDLKKLFGCPRSVNYEELAKGVHLLRLAQSVANSLGVKGKIYIEWEGGASPGPGLWIEYGKKREIVPRSEGGFCDDLAFLKTILSVIRKKAKPENLLRTFHDKGAPLLSLKNHRIVYKIWRDGREVIVVEDWDGNILWKWGISQQENSLPVDPSIPPEGSIVTFLVGNKLHIKDLTNNRFTKLAIPSHPKESIFCVYDNPLFYPSEKYILFGTTYYDPARNFNEQEINLFFTDGERIVYSLPLGNLTDILNLLWAPDQEKLAIMFEKWKSEKYSKYYQKLWVIDVRKGKTMKFKLLPAHYTFIWDRDSQGIYLATKGKRKGELFYLSLKNGKVSRLYKCGEELQIFNLQEDGLLLLKKGTKKLLLYKNGGKPGEIYAHFHKYMLNPSASPGPCCCWGWGGLGCFDLAGPFPTNCVEIAVAKDVMPQKSELFVYPHNTQGERVWLRRIVLSPQLYKEVKDVISKEHPLYWDINPQRGIALLRSFNGGCAELSLVSFAQK